MYEQAKKELPGGVIEEIKTPYNDDYTIIIVKKGKKEYWILAEKPTIIYLGES